MTINIAKKRKIPRLSKTEDGRRTRRKKPRQKRGQGISIHSGREEILLLIIGKVKD